MTQFTSVDAWYLASRDWTGFVVPCPHDGRREDITRLLTGGHEVDGVPRAVVAVEAPCTIWLRKGTYVSLMVRGAYRPDPTP